jgi:hypothetical protein
MKRLFLLVTIVLVILPAFLAFASEYVVKGKAGDYNVTVRIDRNPPARGYNNLDVVITDATGKPVTDAGVQVEYLMPSFPGRPPMMKYSTAAKQSDHHYVAQIDLSMDGVWNLLLKVTREGKTDTMEFTFVVR